MFEEYTSSNGVADQRKVSTVLEALKYIFFLNVKLKGTIRGYFFILLIKKPPPITQLYLRNIFN